MTTKKNKKTVEDTPALEAVPQQENQGMTLADLKMGYIVGITPDGNFVFEIIGKEKGLVELLGLHKFAEKKVTSLLDSTQGSGDRLIQELARMIQQVGMKVDAIAKVVAPTKPENKLE